jgi:hypothetical protein
MVCKGAFVVVYDPCPHAQTKQFTFVVVIALSEQLLIL